MLAKGILGSGKLMSKDGSSGNSWAIQWLGLCTSTSEGKGLSGQRTKIPQTAWQGLASHAESAKDGVIEAEL